MAIARFLITCLWTKITNFAYANNTTTVEVQRNAKYVVER